MVNIHRFNETSSAIDFMVQQWQTISQRAILHQGQFNVALSGGSSPRPLYQRLALEKTLPWALTQLFLVDERFVPVTDPASNYNMIKETLLDPLSFSAENMHPVQTDHTAETAAEMYSNTIRQVFQLKPHAFPVFDLILLGLGDDGHTASLFSRGDYEEKNKLVIHTLSPKPPNDRITLTLPILNHAKNVIFFITGKHKSEIFREVLRGKNLKYPASHVSLDAGRCQAVFVP